MRELSVDEILFIKKIPLKQLCNERIDIVPVSYVNKLASHKDEQIKKFEEENSELKLQKQVLEADRNCFEVKCNILTKLIEKTKCCENCKYEHNFNYCIENNCNNLDKWKLAD